MWGRLGGWKEGDSNSREGEEEGRTRMGRVRLCLRVDYRLVDTVVRTVP